MSMRRGALAVELHLDRQPAPVQLIDSDDQAFEAQRSSSRARTARRTATRPPTSRPRGRVKAAAIAPAPTFHDLRHSHLSRLFAAGRDPVYIATSAADAVATVLRVYAHEYDDARRRASESDELAALYDRASAVEAPDGNAAQQTATARAPTWRRYRRSAAPRSRP
jgi:integrase